MYTVKLAGLFSACLFVGTSVSDGLEKVGLGAGALAMLFFFLKELFNKVLIPWTRTSIETQKEIQQTQAVITRNQEQITRHQEKIVGTLSKVVDGLRSHQAAVEAHMAADTRTDGHLVELLDGLAKKVSTLGCAEEGA